MSEAKLMERIRAVLDTCKEHNVATVEGGPETVDLRYVTVQDLQDIQAAFELLEVGATEGWLESDLERAEELIERVGVKR